MLTPREKSPLPDKFSAEEDQTHDAASRRTASPTHNQTSYSGPQLQIQLSLSNSHADIGSASPSAGNLTG